MKILSCYIENFGTFSKKSFEFHDGLNDIYRQNGWGKTTLAVFLKAMLYGIEYNRASENERKKYLPWNEGRYGGYICFEANEKQYRAERSFGRTDKNDNFALFDLATNMESKDYTEKLGEELFGVDRESFEKSVFIQVDKPQDSLLTDIMASKMSEIPDPEEDRNRLNEALAGLEKRAASIRAKRGNGGILGVLRNQLSEERRQLAECMDAEKLMEQEAGKIKAARQRESLAREELKLVHDQMMIYQYSGCQEEYERLKTEVEQCSKKIEKEKAFFKGMVPASEEIDDIQNHIDEYNVQVALSKENAVTAEDKEKLNLFKTMFQNKVPTETEMDEVSEAIHMLETARQKSQDSIVDTNDIIRFEQLKERFANNVLTDEQIDGAIEKYEQIPALEKHRDTLLAKIKEKKEKQEKDKKKYNFVMLTLFVVAGVVVLIGLVLLLIVNTYLGIGIEIGGIATAIVGYFVIKPAPRQDAAIGILEETKAKEVAADIEKLKLSYTGFIKEYGRKDGEVSPVKAFADIRADRDAYLELENKISIMNAEHGTALKETSEIRQQVQMFFELYCTDTEDGDYAERLGALRENVRDYNRIRDVIVNHNQAVKNALEHKNIVCRFIERYFRTVERPAEQMRTITKNADELKRLTKELSEKKTLLENFCAANDTEKLDSLEKPIKSMEELSARQQRLNEEIAELSGICMQARGKFNEYALVADRRKDLEASVERISAQIAEKEKEYEILNQTSELLKKSGEVLSERYMSDIEMAFGKYVQLLGHETSVFRVDANLNVRIDKEGSLHDKKAFSAGERDLTEICLRLALLDAVYKDGERPVIIMDDPFVNLDDERLLKAKGLVKALAKEYQVIYFACQEGRMG